MPFDYVKIDGEFVQHATSGHIDRLVIEAVVRIAKGLSKQTIAEFVTDEKTKRMVTRLGVDYAQGYHIGKPVPIARLVDTGSVHLGPPPRQPPARVLTPPDGRYRLERHTQVPERRRDLAQSASR